MQSLFSGDEIVISGQNLPDNLSADRSCEPDLAAALADRQKRALKPL
jgi:hypothetical protein